MCDNEGTATLLPIKITGGKDLGQSPIQSAQNFRLCIIDIFIVVWQSVHRKNKFKWKIFISIPGPWV